MTQEMIRMDIVSLCVALCQLAPGLRKGDEDDAKRAVVGRCEPCANDVEASRDKKGSNCQNNEEEHSMGDVDFPDIRIRNKNRIGRLEVHVSPTVPREAVACF
jgi:hypothetical protein